MAESVVKTQVRFEGWEKIKQRFSEMESDWNQKTAKMASSGQKVGDGIAKSSKAATTAVKATGTVGVRSFGLMTTAARGFVSVFSTAINVAAAVGKAVLDIGAKIALAGAGAFFLTKRWVSSTSQSVAELRTMAQSVGVSTKSFSQLSTAVRLVGGDTADLITGLQTLSDKVTDAAKNADGPAAAAFGQVGVSVRNAAGEIKTTEQILAEVADGLSKVDKDTLRASAAFDLFGGASTKLIPILKDGSRGLSEYMDQAKQLGTEVDDAQAQESERLLVKQRRVKEAWRGLGFSVAEALLPAFTKSSDKIVGLITKNSDKIVKWIADTVKDMQGIGDDFARAMGVGSGRIERQWISNLAPAIRLVRDLMSDVFGMMNNRSAKRLPWLNDVADSFWSVVAAAKAFVKQVFGSAGIDLPKIETLAKGLKSAFEGIRNGLSGGDSSAAAMPWASKIGEVLQNIAAVMGAVIGVIVANREEITTVLVAISDTVRNFVEAVASLLSGDKIAKDNPFKFLQPVSDFVAKYGDSIVATFTNLVSDVGAAFGVLWGFFDTFYGWLDSLAQMLGLRSGLQLGLIVFAAWFLGLTSIAQKVGTAISTTLFILNGLFGLFGNLLKLFKGGVGVIATISRLLMKALPAALTVGRLGLLAFGLTFGLVTIAITAVVAVLWYFRDEVWAVMKWVGGALWTIAKGVVNAVWWPIDKLITGLKRVGKWIGLIDEDEAVAPFEAAGERISDAADDLNNSVVESSKKTREIVSVSALQTSEAWGKSFDGIEKDSSALDGVAAKFDGLGETASDAAKGWTDFWETGNVANDFSTASAQRNLQALQKEYSLTSDQMKSALSGDTEGLSVDAKADIGAARIELRSLGHDIEDVAGSAKLIWSRAADGVTDAAKAAGSSISNSLASGLEGAPKIVDGVKMSVEALPDQVRPAIDKLKSQLGEGFDFDNIEMDFDTSALMDGMGDLGAKAQTGLQTAWDEFPSQVQTQVDAAGSAMQTLVDKTDQYQTYSLTKMEKSWGSFESLFRDKIGSVANMFADLWQSMVEVPAAVYDNLIATWSGMPSEFEKLTDRVSQSFDGMWDGIKSTSMQAMLYIAKEIAMFMLRTTAGQAQKALFTPDVLGNAKSAFTQTFTDIFVHQETTFEKLQRLASETVDGLVSSWSGVADSFGAMTDQIGRYFDDLFERIQQRAAITMFKLQADIAATVGKFVLNQMVGAVTPDIPGFATGGVIRGPGTSTSDSILARLSTGEGILNAAAVRWLGEDTIHAFNNLMFPPAYATGGIAGGDTSMPSLGSLNLGVDGKRVATLYADDHAVRAVKRKMARSAQASQGARPRWAGGV